MSVAVGLVLCLLVAAGVLLAAAWPQVRTPEQLEQDGERIARAGRTVVRQSRSAAEVVAAKVGQSAATISGRDRTRP